MFIWDARCAHGFVIREAAHNQNSQKVVNILCSYVYLFMYKTKFYLTTNSKIAWNSYFVTSYN